MKFHIERHRDRRSFETEDVDAMTIQSVYGIPAESWLGQASVTTLDGWVVTLIDVSPQFELFQKLHNAETTMKAAEKVVEEVSRTSLWSLGKISRQALRIAHNRYVAVRESMTIEDLMAYERWKRSSEESSKLALPTAE